MSVIEYNDLLFKVSQRLNELNVGRRLLVMCRGKVAPRSEENLHDVFSLFVELEEKKFLGPDRLDVLKDVLEGLEEWPLLENVEKFETKRKEFDCLLGQIIRALDELNDVERLVSICDILGDPGAVSRVGRKGFKYRRKSPWVPTLTELFPKIQADAGS